MRFLQISSIPPHEAQTLLLLYLQIVATKHCTSLRTKFLTPQLLFEPSSIRSMPSPPPALPRVYADPPQPKSRLYVQLFSWFGLVIAVLHLFEARSLGVLQFILSLIGIYASWENVTSRIPFITVYAVGCLIWAVLDGFYLFLLVSASSKGLRSATIGLIASNTFPNLSSALETFFKSLAESTHFFSIFSSMVSVIFDAVASYWAFSLYSDAKQILATSDVRVPLLRSQPPPHRSGIAGFGSLSRQSPSPQNTPRSMHPFAGRGYRLGFGDN